MAVSNRKHLLTVDEFQRMAEVGVFAEDQRLELVRGELFEMTPIGGRHIACLAQLIKVLSRLFPRVLLTPQCPLLLREQKSEPQPDLAVLRPRDDLATNPPTASDAFLVIEISDTSLAYDRDVKMPLYSESGIPEAWLIDLKSATIFVYRRPSLAGYQEMHPYRRGDIVASEAFPDERFSVQEIVG